MKLSNVSTLAIEYIGQSVRQSVSPMTTVAHRAPASSLLAAEVQRRPEQSLAEWIDTGELHVGVYAAG